MVITWGVLVSCQLVTSEQGGMMADLNNPPIQDDDTDILNIPVVDVRLRAWAEVEEVVKMGGGIGSFYASNLFGEMVKRAVPFLTHYHSDLYIDACYIADLASKGEIEFVYVVREWGTHLFVDDFHRMDGYKRVWGVKVRCVGGVWWATFTRRPGDESV